MTTDQNEKLMFTLTSSDYDGNLLDEQVFESSDYSEFLLMNGRELAERCLQEWREDDLEVRWVTTNHQGDVLENEVYM